MFKIRRDTAFEYNHRKSSRVDRHKWREIRREAEKDQSNRLRINYSIDQSTLTDKRHKLNSKMTKNLPQNIVARVKMLKQPGVPLIPT